MTATRSTRRWLHRGRAFAVAPSSFALDIPHVAFSTGEGICQRKAESSVSFSGARACARARAYARARAGVAWRRAAGGAAARGGAWRRVAARGRRLAVFAYRRHRVCRTQAPGPDRPPGGLPSGVWYTPAAAPLPARAGEEARGPLDSGSLPSPCSKPLSQFECRDPSLSTLDSALR